MDYKDYLEEAKKYVSGGDIAESYRQYYENALKTINAKRENAASDAEKAYRADLNEAAAQSALAGRNTAQYMARRGLARSGEAEQEYIDRSLALGKTASKLAEDRNKAIRSANADAEEAISALDRYYAEKTAEAEKRAEERADEIASKNYGTDRADAEYEREQKAKAEERAYTENLTRIKAELAEAAAQKEREYNASEAAKKREYDSAEAAKKREYDSAEAEKKRAYDAEESAKKREHELEMAREKAILGASGKDAKTESGEETQADGGKTEAAYEPKQTAVSLAKQAVAGYLGSDGRIKDESANIAIFEYIESLRDAGVSEKYLKDLSVAFGAYGYKEPDEDDITAQKALAETAPVYERAYQAAYTPYKRLGASDATAHAKATKYAQNARMEYFLKQYGATALFKKCCSAAGISEKDASAFLKSFAQPQSGGPSGESGSGRENVNGMKTTATAKQ